MRTLERIAAVLVLAALPMTGVKASLTEIYVYGDSLSDTGNVFSLTGDVLPPSTSTPGFPFGPGPGPYFEGRFSNGPIWVDKIGDELGLSLTNMWTPGAVSGAGAINNFAVGGSFTGPFATPQGPVNNTNDFNPLSVFYPGAIPLPGLQQQVDEFIASASPAPDAWHILWAGANDLIFANDFGISPDFEPFLDLTVSNIRGAIEGLASNDAEHFLVLNMPELGATPFALATGLSGVLSDGTDLFNEKLDVMLADVATALALDITLVDVHTAFDAILADPLAAGFPGAGPSPFGPGIGPCFDQDAGVLLCDLAFENPDDNVFWDLVHPSSRTHGAIARTTLEAKVPEPTTFVLLGLSLVALGSRLRRIDSI